MTTQVNWDETSAESVARDTNSLTAALTRFGEQQAQGQQYQRLSASIADELATTAQKGGSYASLRQVIQSHQNSVGMLRSTLDEVLGNLERLEQAHLRREQYSPRWWSQTLQTLRDAFEHDPVAASQQWINIYAQALVDWQLETCSQLVSERFSFPRDDVPNMLLVRHGNASLQNKDYAPALQMLNYLVGRLSSGASEEKRVLCALLLIFIGRIHLYKLKEIEAARQAFERATALTPGDGRPAAASGHASLSQGEAGWAEANRLFSSAIESSPDQPEGYVGKAMLAEARAQWDEADEWCKAAVNAALDETDLVLFLSKLLAPGSGRLYVHVARQLFANNAFDRALAAVELSLELGIADGTSYPSRSALALKADTLLAIKGLKPSPEDAKTIADLYFEAAKYYTWNNEIQVAVDLFKKSRELDSRNAVALFYLADDLRLLNQADTPPFYKSPEDAWESLAAWEAGIALTDAITADTAWVYVARSRIARQLARLSAETEKEHCWQALLFDEQSLLFDEKPEWWADLAATYNWLSLDANMMYVSQKAVDGDPDNLYTMEQLATVLINTGQHQQAEATLSKLLSHDKATARDKAIYRGWQALVDYYQEDYQKALDNLEPGLRQAPDDLWSLLLRANVYRAMGKIRDAQNDERWIWEQRDLPKYGGNEINFARAAFRQSMFTEAIRRTKPFLDSADVEERIEADTITGLSNLALGDFKSADEHLLRALAACNNTRVLTDLIRDIEQMQKLTFGEDWPHGSASSAHLRQSGILERAKAKRDEIKTYSADPIKELENTLANPVTGQAGSSSWLAAQAGLGRLHLEEGNLEAALQAYQALSRYPKRAREARIGLDKVHERM